MSNAEQSQAAAQAQNGPIIRENLTIRMYRIRATFPKVKMTQEKIAKKLRVDQSSISLAMRKPERLPSIAKKVEEYFDNFESSQMQSTQSKVASA